MKMLTIILDFYYQVFCLSNNLRYSLVDIQPSQKSSKLNSKCIKLTALYSCIFTVTTVVFPPSIWSTLRYVTFKTLASQIIQPNRPVTRTKICIGVKWTKTNMFFLVNIMNDVADWYLLKTILRTKLIEYHMS